MDHDEAVQLLAAERYLLNELEPDAREEFEEHLFDCTECALDVRAGAAFIQEAKDQLPSLTGTTLFPARPESGGSRRKLDRWPAWWRPVFVAPAFAALLLAFGYQNLVTFPALRDSAEHPRIVPVAPLPGATRGGAHTFVLADRKSGVALSLELPTVPLAAGFVTYSFDLYDPSRKLVWTGTAPTEIAGGPSSLEIPGDMLRKGPYKLEMSGVGPKGDRSAIETYTFDVHFSE
jgi:hypothetical protein